MKYTLTLVILVLAVCPLAYSQSAFLNEGESGVSPAVDLSSTGDLFSLGGNITYAQNRRFDCGLGFNKFTINGNGKGSHVCAGIGLNMWLDPSTVFIRPHIAVGRLLGMGQANQTTTVASLSFNALLPISSSHLLLSAGGSSISLGLGDGSRVSWVTTGFDFAVSTTVRLSSDVRLVFRGSAYVPLDEGIKESFGLSIGYLISLPQKPSWSYEP